MLMVFYLFLLLMIKKTFEHVEEWIKDFEQNTNNDDIPKFLIGNKKDLKNEIEEELINNFLDQNKNLKYISASAKDKVFKLISFLGINFEKLILI